MAGTDNHKFLVNLGLNTVAADVTGVVEGDLWHNTTEGRPKVALSSTVAAALGPTGFQPIIYSTADTWHLLQPEGGAATTNFLPVLSRAYGYPLFPGGKCTLTGLAMRTNADGAGAIGRPIRMALYGPSATTGLPGSLITDYGTQAPVATTAETLIWTVSTALQPIVYWVVLVGQVSTPTTVARYQGGSSQIPYISAAPALGSNDFLNSIFADGIPGAAPATFPAVGGSGNGPSVYARLIR